MKISKIVLEGTSTPDQNMFCYLQQKIYYSQGTLYFKKYKYKDAFDQFYKSLVNINSLN